MWRLVQSLPDHIVAQTEEITFMITFLGENVAFQQTLCHELGHSLGLDHTSDRNAIMFAEQISTSEAALNSDDIAGIQSVYGGPNGLVSMQSNLRDGRCRFDIFLITHMHPINHKSKVIRDSAGIRFL